MGEFWLGLSSGVILSVLVVLIVGALRETRDAAIGSLSIAVLNPQICDLDET